MNKLRYTLAFFPVLVLVSSMPRATAQGGYPIADRVANKLIAHYQEASCEQLMAKRMTPPSGQEAQEKQRAVQLLQNDPGMRTHFLNKIAAPIANKMFECGMIP